MSLPAGQQRMLDGIAETLRLTEPRMTAMFAIFTRLTKNEPRPCREQLADRRGGGWPRAPWQPLLERHNDRRGPDWRRLLIIGPVAVAVVALVVLTCVTAHGTAGCGDMRSAHVAYASRPPACLAPGSSGAGLVGK
ncbi:MAG TPA: hypothetical protein VMA72_31040 [Streptosporangiaceae bacterium]|nr:hypothetical protein [Streptosporangiaceae bacterium]